MAEDKEVYIAIGRRKTASARVRLVPGTGKVTVNKREFAEYFPIEQVRGYIMKPLEITGKQADFDVVTLIDGGGIIGQAGALRHGIARALLLVDESYRASLKAAGFLTRDPRMKERKKYGLKAARRAPQFSKR